MSKHFTLSRAQLPSGGKRGSNKMYFQGMSPAMAGELCTKASHSPSADITTVTDEGWQQLYAVWKQWVQNLQSGRFMPMAAPPPDCSVSVMGTHPHDKSGSALQLVDDYYRMPEVSPSLLQHSASLTPLLTSARPSQNSVYCESI